MEYPTEGVRVDVAPTGLGVFSLRFFRRHDLIGPIHGEVFHDPRYQSEYCMELGDDLALEPAAPFRYLNHSCHPNCELVELAEEVDRTPETSGLWLEVLATISPGEQMTIDYAWPARFAIPCHCGCPECRGWIVAAEELGTVESAPGLSESQRPTEA